MGLGVSETYVDAGTFLVYINMVVQIDTICIDYSLSLGSNEVSAETYVGNSSFIANIPLDLQFVVEPTIPATPTISWSSTIDISPNTLDGLVSGTNQVTMTFRPRTNGNPADYMLYINNEVVDGKVWDGGDIVISRELVVTDAVSVYDFKLVVRMVDGGVSITSSKTVRFMYMATGTGDGGGDDGGDTPKIPIEDIKVVFSVFLPSSISDSGIMSIILIGGGFFLLVLVGFKYKREGITTKGIKSTRKGRRRK
jgi:hypothetical protein